MGQVGRAVGLWAGGISGRWPRLFLALVPSQGLGSRIRSQYHFRNGQPFCGVELGTNKSHVVWQGYNHTMLASYFMWYNYG